jgi:hypothetical protein
MVNTRKEGGIDLPTNPHNQRVLRQQQQAEMDPPLAEIDPVVAVQMQMIQQMADTMAEMHAQMRQERQEIR